MDSQSTQQVNAIITKLLSVKGQPPGKTVDLSQKEIYFLIKKAKSLFEKQPILLELEAPLQIVGDIHG